MYNIIHYVFDNNIQLQLQLLIQSINPSYYKSHMDEDRMLDHTASMEDIAIEKDNDDLRPETATHMEGRDRDYDPTNYWLMLRGELEWDQSLFLRHTIFESRKDDELEVPN